MAQWDAELAARVASREESAAVAQHHLLEWRAQDQALTEEARQFLEWAANKLLALGVPTEQVRLGWAWYTSRVVRRGLFGQHRVTIDDRHDKPICTWTGWQVTRALALHEYEGWPEKESSQAILLATGQLYASDFSWTQDGQAERRGPPTGKALPESLDLRLWKEPIFELIETHTCA